MMNTKKEEKSVDENNDESNTVAYAVSVTAIVVLVVFLLALCGTAVILVKKITGAKMEKSGLDQGKINPQLDNYYEAINEN